MIERGLRRGSLLLRPKFFVADKRTVTTFPLLQITAPKLSVPSRPLFAAFQKKMDLGKIVLKGKPILSRKKH
jgi:hypothetical protein